MTFDPQFLAILNDVSPMAKGIVGTLFIGLIAGWVARALVPGRDSMGCLMTAVLGVAGAFVALFLGKVLGWYEPGQATGFIGATVGAILLLIVMRFVRPGA